tara:strand:- start:1178 stop:3856 length:2679 start_codon:yes stop_codon:yes gene_type:complete
VIALFGTVLTEIMKAGGGFLGGGACAGRRIRVMACVLPVLLSVGQVHGAAPEKLHSRVPFDQPAQPLDKALLDFTLQTDIQIISKTSDLGGMKSRSLRGRFKPLEALVQILRGSGLKFAVAGQNTIVVGRNVHLLSSQNPEAEPSEKSGKELSEEDKDGDPKALLEEVIVTALKRVQNLQDVPVHMQVLDKDQLTQSNLNRMEDLVVLLPTVTFTQRRGYDQSNYRIRGVGTQILGAGVEPGVATFIDGVVMARGGAALNDLPDVERVEILNGPQGTLFGKNASAGSLNIITKSPNRQNAEASFSTRATSDEEYGVKFSFSGPLGATLAYRFSGSFSDWDGNVKNIITGNDVNGVTAKSLRGKLQWSARENVDVLLSADYSRQNTECCARITREDRLGLYIDPSIAGDARPGGGTADILGVPIGPMADRIAHNRDPFVISTNYGASLTANMDLGTHTLTSISAYRVWEALNSWDNDLLPINFHRQQRSERSADWATQEFRLASPTDGYFDYLLGLYFYKTATDALEYADRKYVNIDLDQIIFVQSKIENENLAFFGHVNYHPTEKLKLFGGFRVLYDQITGTARRGGRDLAPDGGVLMDHSTPEVHNSKSEIALVMKTGLQYDFTDSLNGYVTYGRGYKGRGFGVEFGFDPQRFVESEPIDAERSTSLEAGLKATYFDRRLKLVVTAYHTRIEGLQLGLRDLRGIANLLGSVPETSVRGAEIGLVGRVTHGLTLSGGIAYNNARFDDFTNGLCYLGQTEAEKCFSGAQDLSGHVLENAPRWKGVLSLRYAREIGGLGAYGYLQASYRRQSAVFLSDDADPGSIQDAYGIMDLSLGLYAEDERYHFSLFVKNLFDQKYVAGVSANSADGGGVIIHTVPRDFKRYIGMAVNVNF